MNRPRNLADQISADVAYMGVNGHKQHMFSNGTGTTCSDLRDTLEDAITRFGRRIKIDERGMKHSAAFKQGQTDATYAPRVGADRQELFEYGCGRLKRLLGEMPERHALWPNAPAMR